MIDIIALICRRGFFIASGRKDEDINNAPLSQATGHWANPPRDESILKYEKQKNRPKALFFFFVAGT